MNLQEFVGIHFGHFLTGIFYKVFHLLVLDVTHNLTETLSVKILLQMPVLGYVKHLRKCVCILLVAVNIVVKQNLF